MEFGGKGRKGAKGSAPAGAGRLAVGSTERRQRERTAVREAILQAARDLVLREGWEACTLRKIAKAIEYTPPAIYTHFRDKHQLLMALCQSEWELFHNRMSKLERVTDPLERLRALGRAYVDFALEHRHHYRLIFMTALPAVPLADLPAEVLEGKDDPERDSYAFLRATVRACLETGAVRRDAGDVESVTQMCWAACHGLVSLHITMGEDPWIDWRPARRTAHRLLDVFLDGLCAGAPGNTAPDAAAAATAERAAARGRKGARA